MTRLDLRPAARKRVHPRCIWKNLFEEHRTSRKSERLCPDNSDGMLARLARGMQSCDHRFVLTAGAYCDYLRPHAVRDADAGIGGEMLKSTPPISGRPEACREPSIRRRRRCRLDIRRNAPSSLRYPTRNYC